MKLNRSRLLIFIVILLTCIFIVAPQAREIDSEKWFGIVRSYYDAINKPGTQTYSGWQDGVREGFGLALERLKFRYELLEIRENDKMVAITFLFEMVAFCYNKDGDKKRVEIIRLIGIAIDKKTEKVLIEKILDQAGPTVIHGWNGVDV